VSQMEADSLQVIAAQWVLPVNQAPIENGFVAVAQGKIVALGPMSQLPVHWPSSSPEVGTIITPGLVNAHVHLEQSFPAPIPKAADEPFSAWLLRVVAKLQQDSDPQAKWQRCFNGVLEALSTGTTCVNDIASGPESLEALDALGLRGVVSLEVFHPNVLPVVIDHWVTKYQAMQQAYRAHGLLRVGLSPHSPYNVSPAAWQALVAECVPPLVHTHAAEFEGERTYLQGNLSCVQALHQAILGREFTPQAVADSPLAYLGRFGLLTAHTVVAHAIHTSAADRQQMAQAGASVAHCPRSNLSLHGQTLRAQDWQGLDVAMALGTDGRLSTENLDLRAEARCAMKLHGWNAAEALAAMTLQGAKALGLENDIGLLAPGMSADLVVWQAPLDALGAPEEWALQPETQVSRVMIQGHTRWTRGAV
jgi:cytosine/adenosine deaminase-related metal-dependent hydrolase